MQSENTEAQGQSVADSTLQNYGPRVKACFCIFKCLLTHAVLLQARIVSLCVAHDCVLFFTSHMIVLAGYMVALYLHCGGRYLGVLVVDLTMLLHLWYL